MNFVKAQPAASGLPIARLLERVRRLVRLGDDRDLRHLPTAVQGINAVRLMTIHGAKGLEFSVVHMPGLNANSMPGSVATPECPPPDGMVEGTTERALDAFRAGQLEEQECLFYVAMSRAKDRLIIYAPTQNANGAKRPLSPFLEPIRPQLAIRQITPGRSLPGDPEAAAIELLIDGNLRFDAEKVALYAVCPRRFFYTHVLQIGGRRTETAFMRMHEAVRTIFQGIISGDPPIGSEHELDQRVSEAFSKNGLADHGYATDYKRFAASMIQFFLSIRTGQTAEKPNALRLDFGQEEIFVRPDEVLIAPDGTRTLRNIRTGHKRSKDEESVGVAAFLVAAQKAFPNAAVELVYLSDQKVQPIGLSAKQLQNRLKKLNDFLQGIRAGTFPAERESRRCPACPVFFVCGPTPSGPLRKKF